MILNHEDINRLVDYVPTYTFLGGTYYRIKGSSTYYCPECFWKPRDNYLKLLKQQAVQEHETSEDHQACTSEQPQTTPTRSKRKRQTLIDYDVDDNMLIRPAIRSKRKSVLS